MVDQVLWHLLSLYLWPARPNFPFHVRLLGD
jgi:hypothetical protein